MHHDQDRRRVLICNIDGGGEPGFQYPCPNPINPKYWRLPEYDDEYTPTTIPTDAVCLTEAESDICVGEITKQEFDTLILRFWGCLLLQWKLDTSNNYLRWMEYFRARNHTYGTVHAWIGAYVASEHLARRMPNPQWYCYQLGFASFQDWDEDIIDKHEQVHGVLAQPMKRHLDFGANQPQTTINIKAGGTHPRRIWDVCANRVVPSSWFGYYPANSPFAYGSPVFRLIKPISHSWVAGKDLQYVVSNVNHKLWPVPLPRGVSLEQIRQELINHGVRYTWLDVVCLRQKCGPLELPPQLIQSAIMSEGQAYEEFKKGIEEKERSRVDEWKTDVPLIGEVYNWATHVITYLNGLGIPFSPTGWDDPHHWLMRAWTLQETKSPEQMVIAGVNGDHMSPWLYQIHDNGPTLYEHIIQSTLFRPDNSLDAGRVECVVPILLEMKRRHASNPTDRVAGLFCVFAGREGDMINLPVYDMSEGPEAAWARFMSSLPKLDGLSSGTGIKELVRQLLGIFPYRSGSKWFPTWHQVINYSRFEQPPMAPIIDPRHYVPELNAELIMRARSLYRGVKVSPIFKPDGSLKCYEATSSGARPWPWARSVQKELLIGFRRYDNDEYIPHIDFHKDKAYVIIDVSCRELNNICRWKVHMLIVCEEEERSITTSRDVGSTKHSHPRFRRLVTLGWVPPRERISRDPKDCWLRLEETSISTPLVAIY